MIRTMAMQARILTGFLIVTGLALPQAYTVSAKPGAVSYIEGNVGVNGSAVSISDLRSLFLGANDTLFTEAGKAEVLLSPGVFLRVGENSQVRMIAPSLVKLQIEVVAGEVMVELDEVVPGSSTEVMNHGSSTVLVKTGLYRFTASNAPTIAVLEGKAEVSFGAKKIDLGKHKQALLTEELTVSKLDLDKTDELYVWSNVRAQYDAAVSYQGSKSVYSSGGYGYASGYQTSGLYWNSPFNSWMWMPGNGAFYSPFGWGFYGPGVVAYAPVVGYGYGYGYAGGGYVPVGTKPVATSGKPVAVPINPKHPGVIPNVTSSPAAYIAMRQQLVHSMESSGSQFRTANGTYAANLAAGRTYANTQAASRAASASARSVGSSVGANSSGSTGGWSRGSSAGSTSSGVSARSASSGSSGSSGGGHASASSGSSGRSK